MLTFVGLGLYDEQSVTVAAREALRSCDRAFAEFYTSDLAGTTAADLTAAHDIDVDVEVRDRAGVERDPEPILSAAERADVCFLAAGDAMVSTTHVDLRLRAEERGIDTRVVHGVSAASAVPGLCGLQNYRFGKAVTLPFPDAHGAGAVPPSVVESAEANLDRGLHTLVYLDITADDEQRARRAERDAQGAGRERGRRGGAGPANGATGAGGSDDERRGTYMTGDVAAGLLAEGWADRLGVVVARAGSSDPVVAADRLSALADRTFGGPLHALVLPGSLHHVERSALATLAGAPEDVLEAHDESNG
ncbi:MAG: diphthine synthase [Haloferacaceae archaeon]